MLGVTSFGGSGINLGSGTAFDSDGNLFLTGAFDARIRFGLLAPLDTAGNFDAFVAKLDRDQVPIWSRRFGAGEDDRGFHAAVDASGDVVVIGPARGVVEFDTFTVGTPDRDGSYVAKLSGVDGRVLWVRALPASSWYWIAEGWAQDVTVAASGEVYVTGRFSRDFDFGSPEGVLSAAGATDAYVAKYSADGSPLWVHTLASEDGTTGGVALATDSRGAVFVSGHVEGAADFARGSPNGGVDAFLIKLGPSGKREWAVRVGGPSFDCGLALSVARNDDIFVTGVFNGTLDWDGEALFGIGGQSIYLARVDSDGELIWLKAMSSQDGYSRGIAIVPRANGLAITGTFGSTLGFEDGTTLRTEGMSDIFIARFLDDGSLRWAASFGGQYSDEGQDVVAVNGELVVTGWFAGFVAFGNTPMSTTGAYGVPLIRLRP